MSRVDQIFQSLRASNRKALIPFLTAGDPTMSMTVDLLRELSSLGCPVCEIGFPYSDPLADGPVIQAAYNRALANGICTRDIFQAVASISAELEAAVVGMVSMSIVRRRGLETFAQAASSAGFGGLIVPDLPCEESAEFGKICLSHNLSLIPLVTPTTSDDRARQIVRAATGFVYFVSITGITGERAGIPAVTRDRIRWLRGETDLPICVGFGVSHADQVSTLVDVADGVIVGSAIVRRVASATSPSNAIELVADFVRTLKAPLES